MQQQINIMTIVGICSPFDHVFGIKMKLNAQAILIIDVRSDYGNKYVINGVAHVASRNGDRVPKSKTKKNETTVYSSQKEA